MRAPESEPKTRYLKLADNAHDSTRLFGRYRDIGAGIKIARVIRDFPSSQEGVDKVSDSLLQAGRVNDIKLAAEVLDWGQAIVASELPRIIMPYVKWKASREIRK